MSRCHLTYAYISFWIDIILASTNPISDLTADVFQDPCDLGLRSGCVRATFRIRIRSCRRRRSILEAKPKERSGDDVAPEAGERFLPLLGRGRRRRRLQQEAADQGRIANHGCGVCKIEKNTVG